MIIFNFDNEVFIQKKEIYLKNLYVYIFAKELIA